MPRLNERDRLADLEQRQRKVAEEITQARTALRGRYGALVTDLPVETFTEREFRDLLQLALKAGPAASLHALKAPSSRTN